LIVPCVIGAKSKDPEDANHNEVSYREFLRGMRRRSPGSEVPIHGKKS
jgi:hypothetical protein